MSRAATVFITVLPSTLLVNVQPKATLAEGRDTDSDVESELWARSLGGDDSENSGSDASECEHQGVKAKEMAIH
jgi:hypothetical protein